MNLRPYQQKAIEDVRAAMRGGHKRVMLMMPTGSGKTATASEIIRRVADAGGQTLFVVDRVVLVDQAVRHLNHLGLSVGVMQADRTSFNPDDHVIVSSIQTLARREFPISPSLIVIDEAHIMHRAHRDILAKRDLVPVIGLSATPLTSGLGNTFTRLVQGPSISTLVADGHLVPIKAFGPATAAVEAATAGVDKDKKDFVGTQLSKAMRKRELIADIQTTWKQLAGNRPTLVFATDVAHSKEIVNDFLAEGIPAEHIDAHTPQAERDQIFERFKSGQTTILSAVNVLGIGFDCPQAEVAVLARPTLSLAIHLQQLGRVMRPSAGKECALVLDHAGNIARHGLPEDFSLRSLSDREIERKTKRRKERLMSPCPSCGFMLNPSDYECSNCGHERRKKNSVLHRDGALVSFDNATHRSAAQDRKRFFRELRGYIANAGWEDGAAAYKYRERYGDWPPKAWRYLDPLEPSNETIRWIKSNQIAYLRGLQRAAA